MKNLKYPILDCQVQFDPSCTLFDYGIAEVTPNKILVTCYGFFKYYASFNFIDVFSTLDGFYCHVDSFKASFPQYLPGGINIAGPCDMKNHGKVDERLKEKFVDLCRGSKNFIYRKRKSITLRSFGASNVSYNLSYEDLGVKLCKHGLRLRKVREM